MDFRPCRFPQFVSLSLASVLSYPVVKFIHGFVFCHPQQLLKGLPSSNVDCSDMPYSWTPAGRLDQGQNCLAFVSFKGDYPHPTACNLPVYTSPASLPNRRNTQYEAPHVLPFWMPLVAGLPRFGLGAMPHRTGQRQLRLAYIPYILIRLPLLTRHSEWEGGRRDFICKTLLGSYWRTLERIERIKRSF